MSIRFAPLKLVALAMLFLFFNEAWATHNRAGEIIYKRIEGYKFEIQVITYTEVGLDHADRPELGVNYGDGSGIDSILRTSEDFIFPDHPDIKRNIYKTTHTFPGPGNYTISMLDPNRNGEVVNIPNSIDEMFYIESTLNISLSTTNNSPILLNPPIDFACMGYPYYHSPAAFDPDGDSLFYSLVPCKGIAGLPIIGYSFPQASKFINIDPLTGVLTWDSPISPGEYNIAILIREFRREVTSNGKIRFFEVGSVIRDMQIEVAGVCQNRPPLIYGLRDFCIMAGQNLHYSVFATDSINKTLPDNGGLVSVFQPFGGPFVKAPIATWKNEGKNPLELIIDWNTSCDHVQKSPYTVTYKATDNGTPHLSSYSASEILVVAPPVSNLVAKAETSFIKLSWNREICNNSIGYLIYRRNGASGFEPDSCQTGVPSGIGYKIIANVKGINETTFEDDNNGRGLIPGEVYCYMVVAYFPDGAESYASQEVCTQLKKDVPILTNVSVTKTDASDGSIYLAWSPPNEHDVSVYPGPYSYKIYRTAKRKQLQFEVIGTAADFNDTIFNDVGLNTSELEYMYKIEMLDRSTGQEVSMGFSVSGTSIFLSSIAKDNKLILEWNELVPWRNITYDIYRLTENDADTILIGTTSSNTFTHTNLTNKKTYCYLLKSTGEYSLPSIAKPLFNYSQKHCNAPVDLEPPCPPDLTAHVEDCEEIKSLLYENPERCNGDDVANRVDRVQLTWTNPNEMCDSTDDVLRYILYYSPTINGNYEIKHITDNQFETSFVHVQNNSRAGCFYITAIDSFDNASPVVDTVCTENCQLYELPNVFTPNNDGINDLFRPFPYCYVKSVDLTIMNRWGDVVFETSDPEVLWDGIHQKSQKKVSDGVYYYTCVVHQIALSGIDDIELKGIVHVLGGNNANN